MNHRQRPLPPAKLAKLRARLAKNANPQVHRAINATVTAIACDLAKLNEALVDRMNGIDPEHATWTDAETLASYRTTLRELTDRALRRGEYAEPATPATADDEVLGPWPPKPVRHKEGR